MPANSISSVASVVMVTSGSIMIAAGELPGEYVPSKLSCPWPVKLPAPVTFPKKVVVAFWAVLISLPLCSMLS